jgi:outer membrane protein assembly factor BamB
MDARRLTLVLTLLTRLLAPAAAAEDWPQFRGPDGQGHATATGLPSTWSETQNIRWKVPVPGLGWSSPVVSAGQIWLTTAIDAEQSLRAICLDGETGSVLHDVEVFRKQDLGRIANKNSHASPTPVVDGQHVYVHFGAHGTACLTSEGQVVWKRELKYDQHHGPAGSPVLWRDLLIISCDGHDVQYTIALDKRTGQVRWKADHPGLHAYSTPLLIDVNGAEQLVTSGGGALIAYAPEDGTELWRCRHAGHSVVPRPVAGNGLVYFCTGYWTPTLFAVRPDGQGEVTDSHVQFTLRRSVPHNPSPLLIEDRIYMVSDLGVLTCADAVKGSEIWRQRLTGSFSASPVSADGKIFLVNENATTVVIAPADKYRLIAENHLDGRALASPAVWGRSLLVRTDTHLYRIEEPRNIQAGARISRRDTGTLLR